MFWRWLFCLLEACVDKCKDCTVWKTNVQRTFCPNFVLTRWTVIMNEFFVVMWLNWIWTNICVSFAVQYMIILKAFFSIFSLTTQWNKPLHRLVFMDKYCFLLTMAQCDKCTTKLHLVALGREPKIRNVVLASRCCTEQNGHFCQTQSLNKFKKVLKTELFRAHLFVSVSSLLPSALIYTTQKI